MDPRRPHNLAASLVAVGLDPFDGQQRLVLVLVYLEVWS
jgi:hypothetical protein